MGEEIYSVADDLPGRMARFKKEMIKKIKRMRKERGGFTELKKSGGRVRRHLKNPRRVHKI
jgi:hypothetical protein